MMTITIYDSQGNETEAQIEELGSVAAICKDCGIGANYIHGERSLTRARGWADPHDEETSGDHAIELHQQKRGATIANQWEGITLHPQGFLK